MKNTKKGFTLIELLVVIAIIGILSAIVLASLSTARNKAKDATVEGQLSSMRAAAEIYYGNNTTSYGPTTAVCTTAGTLFQDTASNMKGLVTGITGVACGASATAWAVEAPLVSSSTQIFCVDSTGTSKVDTAISTSSSVTVCP